MSVHAAPQADGGGIAAGFAKLRKADAATPPPASGLEGGFATIARERDLQARLAVERSRYLSASAGVCRTKLAALDACYARSTCGAPALPAGYSESQCKSMPSRPSRFSPVTLTASSCDSACQERISERKAQENAETAAAQARWDAQWAPTAALCRAVEAQQKPHAACLQAHRQACNPQALTQDRCMADRATQAPTLETVRALVARETPPAAPNATALALARQQQAQADLRAREKATAEAKAAQQAKAAAEYKATLAKMTADHEATLARINGPPAPKPPAPGSAADRLAKQAAEKAAKEKAAADYLAAVMKTTSLAARKCPGGEGKYYVVGRRAKISPEVVPCIDVHFRAQCTSSNSFTDGVAPTFIGVSTDCYMGDTAKIDPTPACPLEQVKVSIREVTACSTGAKK